MASNPSATKKSGREMTYAVTELNTNDQTPNPSSAKIKDIEPEIIHYLCY